MIHQSVSDEATLNLAMDIIIELDPDDYLYFIEDEEKRNRRIQLEQYKSKVKPTKGTLRAQTSTITTYMKTVFSASKDDMICAACKKHLIKRYTKCSMQPVIYDCLFYTK